MITEIVNYVLGINSAKAMTYTAADVTAIGTEITSMFEAFLPPVLAIFAIVFSIALLRRLVRSWLGR